MVSTQTKSPVTQKASSSVKGKTPFFSANPRSQLFFQPKLTIGPVDDVYEKEADVVADKVMRMRDEEDEAIQTKQLTEGIQKKCAACEKEEEVQRKEMEGSGFAHESPLLAENVIQTAGISTEGNSHALDVSRNSNNEIIQMRPSRTRMDRVRRPKLSLYQADATTEFFRHLAVRKAREIRAVQVDPGSDCPTYATFGATPYYSGADIIEKMAKAAWCTGNQLEEIHIFSHGNDYVIDASEGTRGRSLYDDPSHADPDRGGRSVGDIPTEIFGPAARIILHGCQTAMGDDNIAERILNHLLGTSPRARVYGHSESGTCGRTTDWREYSGRFPEGRRIRSNPFHPPAVRPKLIPGTGGLSTANKEPHTTESPCSNSLHVQSPAHVSRKCAGCEEEVMQKKEDDKKQTESSSIISDVLASPGTPLDNNTRSFMENRFGYNFGNVRIHTNTLAAKSAQSINALAYTSGHNIVFNQSKYRPDSSEGKHLLAHELTHTLQQGAGAVRPKVIQRNTHPPRREDCDALDDFIRLIVVNQESPQTVTIFWNHSGNTETSSVSTGKGTCCIDSTADDNVVGATQAGSRTDQSNWTPIGIRPVEKILNLGPDDQRRYWTEFHDDRDIALHAYNTFDGTPLSHGCVRMSVDMAKKIYCGSIIGRTIVEVRGFARPRCSNTTLQAEWAGDGISPVPRCTSRSGLDAEVERLQRISPSQANQTIINDFRINLGRSTNVTQATAAARTAGTDLWTRSHGTTAGTTVTVDDRPLYWTRNFIVRELQEWNPVYTVSRANRASIINTFEMTSRGLNVTTFRAVDPGVKKILITGFDPFGMDDTTGRVGAVRGLTVGNPSGAIVLALDGQTVSGTNCSAMVQGAVFPVRYADFNQGIVENYVRNFISGGNAVDMIMTISRNRDDRIFELERFAARARGGHPDNAGLGGTQSELDQSLRRIHPGSTRRDEFITSTLPRSGMQSGSTVVSDDTYTGHLPDGTQIDETTHVNPPANAISDSGSGGSFLSNEIFYRVGLLQLNQSTRIPMGHLHVPAATQSEYQGVVNTVRQIITRALNNSLCSTPSS